MSFTGIDNASRSGGGPRSSSARREAATDHLGRFRAAPAPLHDPYPRVLPTVAGFEILDELGRGGMGVVYRARQLGLNRVVALKMLLGGPFADPDYHARFRREAEAVARLHHPHIIQVFTVGVQESPLGDGFACPYFVQEFVDGGSLAHRLNDAPQPPREAAALVEVLARAVHHAHEHDVVHRDLKPSNILLRAPRPMANDKAGDATELLAPAALTAYEPKVGDFGLAKRLDDADGCPTINGVVVGTPAYMAPEQAAGDADAGPAVDIYALGVILYEVLTGRRPFGGATALETLELVRHQEPVPPRALQPKVPRDLETICLKCLQKEPHRRYATAQALADDLRHFLDGEPIVARPLGLAARTWRRARRHPAVATLALLVFLTTVAGMLGVVAAWLHAQAGWTEAVGQRAEAERRREEAESTVYFGRIAQARLEGRLGNLATAQRLLDLCLPTEEGALDRRGWEWHYLHGLLHADLLTIPSAHDPYVTRLAFSPDGATLVSVGGSPFSRPTRGTVKLWRVSGDGAGQCLWEKAHARLVNVVGFGAAGREVSWIGDEGTLHSIETASQQPVRTRQLPREFFAACFSRDGRRIAVYDQTGHVRIRDIADDREVLAIRPETPVHRILAFAADGRHLAIGGGGIVSVWDTTAGRQVWRHHQPNENLASLAVSPDARLVAVGGVNGVIRLWDVNSGTMLQSLAGHAGSALAVEFSPDGRRLASAGADQTVRLWQIQNGVELRLFRGHCGRVSCLSFHPTGHFLASGSMQPGEIKMWDLTRPQEYLSVTTERSPPGRVEGLGFAADGALHMARHIGLLQTCDAVTGVHRASRTVDVTPRWLTPAALVAFRADGREFAAVSRQDGHCVHLIDVATGEVHQRLEHTYDVLHVAYSGDGRRLATSALALGKGNLREVTVWDTATGQRLATVPFAPSPTVRPSGTVALSPDGAVLAHDVARTPGETDMAHDLVFRDAATGAVLRTVPDLPSAALCLAFSPDGRLLAVTCYTQGMVVYDWAEGRWLHATPLNSSTPEALHAQCFSPDGRRLAAVSRTQVHIWDAASGQLVLALRGAPPRHADNGFNPRVAWSPDGRRLAASNWNNTVSIWDSADRQSPEAKATLRRAAEERAGSD